MLIEVKGAGYFHKTDESEEILREQKKKVETETGKTRLYLLLWTSERRYPISKRGLGSSVTFILKTGKKKRWGEWERFVKKVRSYC